MENLQSLIEQIRMDISNGKSEEEIFQWILPILKREPEYSERLIELMATIPDRMVATLLKRMFEETSEKRVRKMIKRSLYRLRIKGVVTEEFLFEKERSILRPLQPGVKEGFASGIDSLGHRLLILAIPYPGRGLTVMDGVIGDRDGVIDFTRGEMPRKEFKGFLEASGKKISYPMVEMEPSYVSFLFSKAYQLSIEKKKDLPQDYLLSKGEIETLKREYPKPLIYSYLRTDQIEEEDGWRKRGGELLQSEMINTWEIDEEEIRSYAEELWEAKRSRIVLNPTQKELRFQSIYQKALREIFSEEKKFLYQRRLEEMAYVFLKWGKEEEATISLAIAMDLEKPLNLLQPNPFLFQLVIKSILRILRDSYEKKKEEVSLIIKP